MRSSRLSLVLVAMLAFFLILKESREPYLSLFADDVLRPKAAPYSLSLSPGLDVRLYSDTRPHVGKIARLQKGLVLVSDGREWIEEGFGFGLPLIEVDGQAHLSRSASVETAGDTLIKRYQMDTVDTPSGFLRRKYLPVPSIGTVAVTYTLQAGDITVAVDLSGLRTGWDKAYIMNEQGARFFTHYEEPALVVEGEDLGQWQPTMAQQGCMVADDRSLRFCVKTRGEITKFYGRERYNQYYWVGVYSLSWAGIDIEMSAPASRLEYSISMQRQAHD
jgi:hypothetical protein